jgi:PadR family transcriptional regulator PadR
VEHDASLTQMRKGALEHCVLALLTSEPRYAFEVVKRLAEVEGMLVTEGTIYPLLSRLRKDGMVQSRWRESADGPPRRYYEITGEGRRALESFRSQWSVFRTAVDTLLQGQDG